MNNAEPQTENTAEFSQQQLNDQLQDRISELETKVAFQDHTIEQLSDEIGSHQESISKLQQQLRLLGDRFKQIKNDIDNDMPQSMEHEIPPHY